MKQPPTGARERKSLLPKIVDFFKQLSLFEDEIPVLEKKVFTYDSLCVGPYSHLKVQVKPRIRENWRVIWTRRHESLRIEIPSILEFAPTAVKEALLQWAVLVSKRAIRGNNAQKLERRRLETVIRNFLKAPSETPASVKVLKRLHAQNKKRLARMEPLGKQHDLVQSFSRVNQEYFRGSLNATLTWSRRIGGLSTHSIAEDGNGDPYHLISISRGYDCLEVTEEILDGVMYHECLHIAIPPEIRHGRRIVHGPEFRKRERQYRHFEIWRDWHRHGLPKSLHRMKRDQSLLIRMTQR